MTYSRETIVHRRTTRSFRVYLRPARRSSKTTGSRSNGVRVTRSSTRLMMWTFSSSVVILGTHLPIGHYPSSRALSRSLRMIHFGVRMARASRRGRTKLFPSTLSSFQQPQSSITGNGQSQPSRAFKLPSLTQSWHPFPRCHRRNLHNPSNLSNPSSR